jgi:oligopeptide transport system permease protein
MDHDANMYKLKLRAVVAPKAASTPADRPCRRRGAAAVKQEGLLRHAATRFLGLIPTMLLLITIAFFMIRVAPGGPFDSEKVLPPEIRANLDAKYHLDEPLLQQYFRYLGQIVSGDFGPSFQYKDWSVNELIWRGFPVSAAVGGLAMLLAFVVGS